MVRHDPHYSFFLPDIRRDAYAAKAKQLLELFVDIDAYNFMPRSVADLNEQGRGKSSKVMPLKTEGDGNCLPRAISRGSTFLARVDCLSHLPSCRQCGALSTGTESCAA